MVAEKIIVQMVKSGGVCMRCAKASRHAGHGNEDLKGMMSACVVTRQADMLVYISFRCMCYDTQIIQMVYTFRIQ